MSLNPIQFGTQVVDQFGRYLLTTFPIADSDMAEQVKDHLRHGFGGERYLAKGPYVYLNQPFEQGPSLVEILYDEELNLHSGVRKIFPFEYLHKHQEEAIRAICAGKHTIMATSTGSGKTEGFLIPIIDHCLKLRDAATSEEDHKGVVAVLVYPMNALVNDQIRRLRPLLAGTKVTFGKYTGETPPTSSDAINQLNISRPFTKEETKEYEKNPDNVPLPWEECFSKADIRNRKPRLLLTNYKQLEFLLLRDQDLDLFRRAPVQFLVFDEVHTYTGTFGSEVACLIRRLKNITGRSKDIICIGTSATVAPEGRRRITAEKATRPFASRLFGVPEGAIEIITERYKKPSAPPADMYTPPPPVKPHELMERILSEAKTVHLQDEVSDIPHSLLEAAEELCGEKAVHGITNMEKLFNLLNRNRLVFSMGEIFTRPILFDKALPRLRAVGQRTKLRDDELAAEIIAYLTLGAIAQEDGEPVLRPKLHYFIQGLQGLWASPEDGGWRIHFNLEKGQKETEYVLLPLKLCRACGQHYFRVLTTLDDIASDVGEKTIGYRIIRVADDQEAPGIGEEELYLTDRLTSEEEEEYSKGDVYYLCRYCGTLHSSPVDTCLNESCGRKTRDMLKVMTWGGELTQCRACTAVKRGDSPPIRTTKSGEVSDITILAQLMLSAMPEKALQKVLIFADNRQDAAYQAGWMEERSKRFRLRHLLFRILDKDPQRIWRFEKLVELLVEEAQNEGIIPRRAFSSDDEEIKIKWFLLEEFATTQQRRRSVENLGLARIFYDKLEVDSDRPFFEQWGKIFGIDPQSVLNLVKVLLDYYRRRGVLSDPLLQRRWGYTDKEVRDGLIIPPEHFRPQVIVPESIGDTKVKHYVKVWRSKRGISPAQQIVKKSILRGEEDVEDFLKSLWKWLRDKKYLVPARLVYKRHGTLHKIEIPGEKVQINIEIVGISATKERYFCRNCRKSQSVPLYTSSCPEWNCKGKTELLPRDDEDYDVVQYTKFPFAPLKTYEHSAQVPKEKREEIEQEFKREDGKYNCIVCTPTLELGVDIGKLETILMRNVPPTPANYAQRSGRSGRRHRIAVVFTYSRGTQHDRYFFNDPPAMISGEIRVPAFSMQNEPLIRKHIHSTTLTCLRELTTAEEKETLQKTFPSYIWSYFAKQIYSSTQQDKFRLEYFKNPPNFSDLFSLIQRYENTILARLTDTFTKEWPEQDAEIVDEEELKNMLFEMPKKLQFHINRLFTQVQTYNYILKKYSQKILDGVTLTDDEQYERKRFENALDTFRKENKNNYSLTYLSDDGFFPGYALSREGCLAQCFDPYQELSRPSAIALREFTPANWLYANKHVFKVQRLNFYKFSQEGGLSVDDQITQRMIFDRYANRIFDESEITTEGGDHEYTPFESFELNDIELHHVQNIDDRSDARRRIAFEIYGLLLNQHGGGHQGKINQYDFIYLTRELIRLVNIGPKVRIKKNQELGFPICPRCGETRSPFASQTEFDRFVEIHQKYCRIPNIIWGAVHVETRSDVLKIGPYPEYADAVNVTESLRIGSRQILDMANMDVECFVAVDQSLNYWAVLYDPVPGGSGFLPQILKYWPDIINASIESLEKCDCEKACYTCMLHFRNQQYHEYLDRNKAIELSTELRGIPQQGNEIPATSLQTRVSTRTSDSDAEVDFVRILQTNNFPLPPSDHYMIDLGGGSSIEADYAYPDNKVLIFIDGTSKQLHGDPQRRRYDKIQRAKVKMRGYNIIETTAQGLSDSTNIKVVLNELAIYLNRYDLVEEIEY